MGSQYAKRRPTLFNDVCGSMDELKRLTHEERTTAGRDLEARAKLLVEDAVYMIGRMRDRIGEYITFAEEVNRICGGLNSIGRGETEHGGDGSGRGRDAEAAANTDTTPVDGAYHRIRALVASPSSLTDA